MDKEEIKRKIEICETIIDLGDKTLLRLIKEVAKEELTELQAQLAEAEKPKLRHGDYGIVPRGMHKEGPHPVLADPTNLCFNDGYWKDEDGHISCSYGCYNGREITNRGNIFDDLKAISKSLHEFEVFGIEVKFIENGALSIGNQIIPKPWVAEFCRNLRILEATFKKQAAEGKGKE